VVAALLLAAACSHWPGLDDEPAPVARAAPAFIPPLPPQRPALPLAEEEAPAPDPGKRQLASVFGFDEDQLRALFGTPSWVEEVPPAVEWQYGTASCTLRVFFFMEVSTRNFRVLSYDLTSKEAADVLDAEQRCYTELVDQAAELGT
jgi:hypothetical protein